MIILDKQRLQIIVCCSKTCFNVISTYNLQLLLLQFSNLAFNNKLRKACENFHIFFYVNVVQMFVSIHF